MCRDVSSNLVNAYYHFNLDCVRNRFPQVELKDIALHDEVRSNLILVHAELLHKHGLREACMLSLEQSISNC